MNEMRKKMQRDNCMNRFEYTDVVWNEERLLHEWHRVFFYVENPQCVRCIIHRHTHTHTKKNVIRMTPVGKILTWFLFYIASSEVIVSLPFSLY